METFYELYRADLVACTNPGQITGVADSDAFCFPRITIAGREALEKWKQEERESRLGWQIAKFLQKAALWIGLLLGVAQPFSPLIDFCCFGIQKYQSIARKTAKV
jgi:hypothetical protein